jgi:glutamyl/glutaminyl-tRNA synthetase
MKVSFEHNGKRYVNFDLSDEKVVEQLKSLGVDVETLAKKEQKKNLSQATDSYIQQKLSSIDEDLADLVSEKSWLEGVFAAHSISPEEVRNATVAVILGQKTVDEAVSDLSIPSDLVPDFQRAVEIAKIIAWKESIWKKEAELEAQIDSMTLEELLQLDVKKLCEDAYSGIPLEV